MPGKKITDQQVRKYKAMRRTATQEIAAARMGISVRSARRIEKAATLPSQRGPRTWRTRVDPLAGVWDAELVPLLEAEPGLQGRTLFEELQSRPCKNPATHSLARISAIFPRSESPRN